MADVVGIAERIVSVERGALAYWLYIAFCAGFLLAAWLKKSSQRETKRELADLLERL